MENVKEDGWYIGQFGGFCIGGPDYYLIERVDGRLVTYIFCSDLTTNREYKIKTFRTPDGNILPVGTNFYSFSNKSKHLPLYHDAKYLFNKHCDTAIKVKLDDLMTAGERKLFD